MNERGRGRGSLTAVVGWTVAVAAVAQEPRVVVRSDNHVIDRSCVIEIPADTVIADPDGNGVLHINASAIRVAFAPGSVLRGAAPDAAPDRYRGTGIRIAGVAGVTLVDARVSGYWCGLHASDADGLTLERCDASDNRRARLGSTPAAEDRGDWLYPHDNDNQEWLERYGAALYVERARDVTIAGCRVRQGQNGLVLDRVNDARVYDNDFSFNSGWGIALWRSSRNVISRNACDFNVRGYSHGVYNRGQDSAGILMFEQCCDNVIAENSATHSGDGFFGFAGQEALGVRGDHPDEWYRRRGNNDNLLIGNDFSYAPAHGIEMTFSFGNRFVSNRLVGNAICGVWGGYSQETTIAGNTLADNGAMAYGLERGGVNIEHGRNNQVLHNDFAGNHCGVHLWWDPDGSLGQRPWARVNGTDSAANLILGNTFTRDVLALQFRGPSEVTIGPNTFAQVAQRLDAEADATVHEQPGLVFAPFEPPAYEPLGTTRPVGARGALRGRAHIVMTQWGPWDHASPLLRAIAFEPGAIDFELRGWAGQPQITLRGDGLTLTEALDSAGGASGAAADRSDGRPHRVRVSAERPGVYPFELTATGVSADRRTHAGTLVHAQWQVRLFTWDAASDPRAELAAWRARAENSSPFELASLSLPFGGRGMADLDRAPAVATAGIGPDHFGLIARTRLPLPAGTWHLRTLSDDGVRVTIDGDVVLENWTWHAPTRDSATFEQPAAGEVEIEVEYFEIDGAAVLEFELTPA